MLSTYTVYHYDAFLCQSAPQLHCLTSHEQYQMPVVGLIHYNDHSWKCQCPLLWGLLHLQHFWNEMYSKDNCFKFNLLTKQVISPVFTDVFQLYKIDAFMWQISTTTSLTSHEQCQITVVGLTHNNDLSWKWECPLYSEVWYICSIFWIRCIAEMIICSKFNILATKQVISSVLTEVLPPIQLTPCESQHHNFTTWLSSLTLTQLDNHKSNTTMTLKCQCPLLWDLLYLQHLSRRCICACIMHLQWRGCTCFYLGPSIMSS